MTQHHYSLIQTFIQKFSSTRPGAWCFSRAAHRADGIFLKLSHGRTTLTNIISGLPVVILTTTGAKSGLPRTLPLAYVCDGRDADRFAVVASNFGQHHHPGWYYNLKAHPQAVGFINGRNQAYIAHEAAGEEYDRFWRLACETFFGFSVYQQLAGSRHLPIMVLVAENYQ